MRDELYRLARGHPVIWGGLLAGISAALLTLAASAGGATLQLALGLGAGTGLAVATSLALFFKQRQDLAQMHAMIALQSLGFQYPLFFAGPWTISPDLAQLLVEQIGRARPRVIVECGSGASTVVMAHALRKLGGGKLYALEHEAGPAMETRQMLEREGLTEIAEVILAPLGDATVNGQAWRWYELQGLDGRVGPIELVFVDGPPAPTGTLARYPALPLLRERLAPCASIVLDDGRRRGEREIVRRWVREYPDIKTEWVPTRKGTWVLRTGPTIGRASD